MHKIIYFDEGTATDYIEITKGGKYEEFEEKIKDRMRKAMADIEAEASAKFSLFPFLKMGAGTQMNGEVSNHSNKIITNTLSNTVLTDYLKISKKDRKIKKFKKCNIYAYKESMTFFKMYTPWIGYTKLDSKNSDMI
ncbi:DUF6414 family protein [Paramaledivibacter caminithermalis]|jgi:hypothetical protein|uniref:Uncharacterized protein n=1 Tax=Paramaledivibacter caminithermalis (strain DSM 15212 / CIP 107654 / DViRD3) TaxID=1121301 RepID=A0A1M6T8I5_PARC5|nr:DUF6414 family protein [Paramaledivibacter caminithermalis]SHK53260.1 hypothetical protein SAMN02745912_03598 [Paramaledivibacter caminithermalis DSM 15212]